MSGGRTAWIVSATPRQVEVLRRICCGETSDKAIARTLNMAPGTVRSHVRAMLQGLGLRDRAGLLLFGLQHPKILRYGACEWTQHPPGTCQCGGPVCKLLLDVESDAVESAA